MKVKTRIADWNIIFCIWQLQWILDFLNLIHYAAIVLQDMPVNLFNTIMLSVLGQKLQAR
jgi:hypothetical protein